MKQTHRKRVQLGTDARFTAADVYINCDAVDEKSTIMYVWQYISVRVINGNAFIGLPNLSNFLEPQLGIEQASIGVPCL